MSKEQQLGLDAILRQGGLDTGGDVPALRTAFAELMSQIPVAPDIQQTPIALGGVAGIQVVAGEPSTDDVILYFHGGVYVIGSASASVPLAGDIARRTGMRVDTLDYRLGPEHPYPAAVQDAVAAYDYIISHYRDDPTPALHESVAHALVSRGVALGRLGRFEEELAAYDDVISHYRNDPARREQVAKALYNRGVALEELVASRTEPTDTVSSRTVGGRS